MRLKDITILGPQYSGKAIHGDVSFVPMECLRNGSIDAQEISFSEAKGKYTFFADGDLLMAKVTPCFENGNIAVAKDLKEGVGFGSSEIFVLRPKKGVLSSYLFYLTQSAPFMDSACATMCGVGGLKRITPLFMKTHEVHIPSITEQKKVVICLQETTSKIESILSILEEKKSLFLQLKNSIINNAVTHGLNKSVKLQKSENNWIGDIPIHWCTKRMKELFCESKATSLEGKEDLLSVSEYYGVAKRSDKMADDELYESRADSLVGYKICQPGDLVINIMLAWKTGLGISDYHGIVSPAYAVYNGKNIVPHYYHYLLRTNMYVTQFKRNSKGIIDSRLRMYTDRFNNIPAIYPPLEEQQAIADFLDEKCAKIDSAIEIIDKQISRYTELKKSLINEVITGKRAI